MEIAYIVTCEHGGNRIPAAYANLFARHSRVLATHRGYDHGALATARMLSRTLGAPLVFSTVSRLVVELNRSPRLQFAFSPVMRRQPEALRVDVARRHYAPYRARVEALVASAVAAGRRVVHISSHTFTPRLHGVTRRADAGLLYDPRRASENALCIRWQRTLRLRAPDWVVRRNYPYQGRDDGLTQYLRTRFPDRRYIGIELEVNQKHMRDDEPAAAPARAAVVASLLDALADDADAAPTAPIARARRSRSP